MASIEEEYSSDNDDDDYVPNAAEGENDSDVEESETNGNKNDAENHTSANNDEHKDKVDEFWKSLKVKNGEGISKSRNETDQDENTASQIDNANIEQSNDVISPNFSRTLKNDTVTITKIYDFAGEDVKVTKEVKKDSKEAIEHLKKQELKSTIPASSKNNILAKVGIKKRTSSGLGNILGKLGKKPKLSTLEKSKHDWNKFKQETDIQDELNCYNKGKEGYLEKVSFLERTEIRQFNQEKDLRLSKRNRR